MSININQILKHQFTPTQSNFTERDTSLYALSIGAASDPTDTNDLSFVYELSDKGHKAFPTMAVTFPFAVLPQLFNIPGLNVNPIMIVHGEQYFELKRPLPTAGNFTNQGRITDIFDKGSGALLILESSTLDEAGHEIALNRSALFVRGKGGFGGERGPSGKINLPPARDPDATFQDQTQPNQALLYRLNSSGDRNPLHADPQMAAVAGFDRPILHGLCTYGFAARAVLKQFAHNDISRFKSMHARFSKHVFPGETLVTEMWQETPERILFQTKVIEREAIVLSNAAIELQPAKQ
ncbi:MAG: 3-alpha,7-alpha,12-alpha-trihydroxy-5-beta-cholest-24-enoyl-CoA hydratase [Chloroflexi bacterium]|nr:MAG: 3-alpha,7-alpha,12-alpha-trihydroxy-5-beta-cholest-24-enoyl-CoA hydratase [Chloroflexota bacterium]PIE79726.1 MAG: 3-alpha,7-alpha,12-alpha-trihydroxy-5-beta-cholest-24-enoyl-CoA hydratase [Chloroflexota bacterium]